jgi:hypothetical protein
MEEYADMVYEKFDKQRKMYELQQADDKVKIRFQRHCSTIYKWH